MMEWDALSEPTQLRLADAALREASRNLARYAEALAAEMQAGFLADCGGQEALRLFATLVRTVSTPEHQGMGRA